MKSLKFLRNSDEGLPHWVPTDLEVLENLNSKEYENGQEEPGKVREFESGNQNEERSGNPKAFIV